MSHPGLGLAGQGLVSGRMEDLHRPERESERDLQLVRAKRSEGQGSIRSGSRSSLLVNLMAGAGSWELSLLT